MTGESGCIVMIVRGKSSNIARTSCGQRNVYLPFQMGKKRTTLNNMCAVHWGCAMRWGEGLFSAWRVSVHWGYTCNTLGGFSSMHWRDIMIYVEGYHECIRGYPECTGDVQCIRGISSMHWRRVDIVYVMEHPQCTYDIPTQVMISSNALLISPQYTDDIPKCTGHPQMHCTHII